jgi:hypothetical protein
MAIIFKLLWLFLRSLERGGVSEIGLAQSERQLSTKFDNKTQDKKDRDLPCRLFIGNGVSISRQEERFWKARGKIWNVVCNKGLRDALLRGPKTFVLCNRKPSYSVLWSVLGVARS